MDKIAQQIIEYADNDAELGWLEFEHEGQQWRFPKRATVWAVLGNSAATRQLLPEYEAFADTGWKLQLDNSYHTDALLGAGIDIDNAYDRGPAYEAWHHAGFLIEQEYRKKLKFDFTVLVNNLPTDRTYISVQVYDYKPLKKDTWTNSSIFCADPPKEDWDLRRCIVIPNGSIDYDLAAQNADVIITETGGPLCHLATVSRERGKLMIRMDNAVKRFPRFSTFDINLTDLTIDLV